MADAPSPGHCSECDPSYGCFSGRGPCCKSPEPREDGAEYDRRRALRIAWQYTLETQTCEEAVSDLCRQLRDAREQLAFARAHGARRLLREFRDSVRYIRTREQEESLAARAEALLGIAKEAGPVEP